MKKRREPKQQQNVRMSVAEKAVCLRAAELENLNLCAFIRKSALDTALGVIRKHVGAE